MRRLAYFLSLSLLAMSLVAADNKKVSAKKDPDEIGNRDVGKGVNFYSIEKEIGLGKGLAQQIEQQAKIVNDPVIAEAGRLRLWQTADNYGGVAKSCVISRRFGFLPSRDAAICHRSETVRADARYFRGAGGSWRSQARLKT